MLQLLTLEGYHWIQLVSCRYLPNTALLSTARHLRVIVHILVVCFHVHRNHSEVKQADWHIEYSI